MSFVTAGDPWQSDSGQVRKELRDVSSEREQAASANAEQSWRHIYGDADRHGSGHGGNRDSHAVPTDAFLFLLLFLTLHVTDARPEIRRRWFA
ncbi:hypothetical protein LMG27198_23330 [Methylocystis echinoides]|uniref:Uncharacterized protein n=1 Tax=Methylocystis echinoides TaxID=29468 RepID=A0A9W6GUL5_9HYPH|nr:hypothetical protein LMG27198_23330 [Methylocystis echinoides]